MKILIVITKGEVGGAQMSVFNLAKKLHENGFDVTVGYGMGNFLKSKLDDYGIKNVQFKNLKRGFSPITNISFIFEIKKYIEKNKIEAVHFNSSNTLFGAIGARIASNKSKTVFTYRGMSVLDENYTGSKLKKVIYRMIFKFLLSFVDNQVFVSKQNQEEGKKAGLAKNDVTIYNGLDPELLKFKSREEARSYFENKLNISFENKTVVGSIGRLAYQKNYEFLINQFSEIMKSHPNIICIILGDGLEKKKYTKLISQLGLEKNVLLAGNITEGYRYMKAFDIFVLPSRYEGFSVTLIEALFAGLPILATEVGGAREQIGDAGLLYKLDNSEEFMDKISILLKDSDERKKYSQLAEKKAGSYNINRTAQGYEKIFMSV